MSTKKHTNTTQRRGRCALAGGSISAVRELEKLMRTSARYWQNNTSDPHGIATALYVSHLEIANNLRIALRK